MLYEYEKQLPNLYKRFGSRMVRSLLLVMSYSIVFREECWCRLPERKRNVKDGMLNHPLNNSESILSFNAETDIPCCTVYWSIHEGCVVCVFLVLNVAEDVLSTCINRTCTETFCGTAVENHEGVCLLNL